MQELILIVLLNLGINVQPGSHFTMSPNLASKIRSAPLYQELGGDIEFSKCVTVIDNSVDDIVITDDDNPNDITFE